MPPGPMIRRPRLINVAPIRSGVLAVNQGAVMSTQDTLQARDFFAQKLAFLTGPYELHGQMRRNEPIVIVDVRLPSDYQAGHIPGAISLPQGKWHTLAGLTKERTAVVYCYSQT